MFRHYTNGTVNSQNIEISKLKNNRKKINKNYLKFLKFQFLGKKKSN